MSGSGDLQRVLSQSYGQSDFEGLCLGCKNQQLRVCPHERVLLMFLPGESGGELHKLLGCVSQVGLCWLKIDRKWQRNGGSAVWYHKNNGLHDAQSQSITDNEFSGWSVEDLKQ